MTSLTLPSTSPLSVSTPLIPRKFAFLVHSRHAYNVDLGLYWKPLRKVPNAVYRQVFNRMKAPSVKWSDIYLNNPQGEMKFLGSNEAVLLTAQALLSLGTEGVHKRIDRIIDKLVRKGYQNIGLGGFTSPMTLGGQLLKHRTDVSITNGNAFTAVSLYRAILKLLQATPTLVKHHSIVGATGSVGSCLAKLLVKNHYCEKLQLVARDLTKLETLKKELKVLSPSVVIEITEKVEAIKKSSLTTLLTASTDNIIRADMLSPNAVVLDGTQPRNTSPKLTAARPDVTVIDGGIISIPGITLKNGGFGLPRHHHFACFSETLLWALEGQSDHFSIGYPMVEQAEHMEKLALKHQALGFGLADFTSFGKPLQNSAYATEKQ